MATRKAAVKPEVPREPMRIEARDGRSVLHLEGVVGVAQAKRLHLLALELAEGAGRVDVRCEHLKHLDCAAAQVLLALSDSLGARGATLAMHNLPESVRQSLRNAGLASAL